jgi:hypothetical protein
LKILVPPWVCPEFFLTTFRPVGEWCVAATNVICPSHILSMCTSQSGTCKRSFLS